MFSPSRLGSPKEWLQSWPWRWKKCHLRNVGNYRPNNTTQHVRKHHRDNLKSRRSIINSTECAENFRGLIWRLTAALDWEDWKKSRNAARTDSSVPKYESGTFWMQSTWWRHVMQKESKIKYKFHNRKRGHLSRRQTLVSRVHFTHAESEGPSCRKTEHTHFYTTYTTFALTVPTDSSMLNEQRLEAQQNDWIHTGNLLQVFSGGCIKM